MNFRTTPHSQIEISETSAHADVRKGTDMCGNVRTCADMCGNVWEFVLDHFDPTGGHEEIYFLDSDSKSVTRPVCRGGNYFDVPGNARSAVRLGIFSVSYSDSRDGFRICLGPTRTTVAVSKE